jgi:hypothetical protein
MIPMLQAGFGRFVEDKSMMRDEPRNIIKAAH